MNRSELTQARSSYAKPLHQIWLVGGPMWSTVCSSYALIHIPSPLIPAECLQLHLLLVISCFSDG